MQAHINGTVSGIGAGDSISQIEIVWKTSSGEAEATAVAAGRGVTLTSNQDMANFSQTTVSGTAPNASGYVVNSVNLVSESTYYGSVRVTENKSGGGTQAGTWSTPVSFTPTTLLFITLTNTINDTFNRSTGINGAGANWINTAIGYTNLIIVSNTVVTAGSGVFAGMNWAANPGDNQYAQADIVSESGSGNIVAMVRSSASANTCYQGAVGRPISDYEVRLNKYLAGTQTSLGSSSPAETVPGSVMVNVGTTMPLKVRIGVKGTSLQVDTFNGSIWTTRITALDSDIASGYPALSVQSGATADNFAAGTL
jgi:hypothetical protein